MELASVAMEREELDRMDREALIARAETLRIPRARILTRPELVDEILMAVGGRSDDEGDALAELPGVRAARGFFGRARDLLARVVERGLHLPDAAERIRKSTLPPPRRADPPMPTVTLAEIYAAQGHTARALETLRSVLAIEPDHAPARALLTRLEVEPPRAPVLPPEEDEPQLEAPRAAPPPRMPAVPRAARVAPPPDLGAADPALGDVCVAIPDTPVSLFVFWNATTASADLALRFVVLTPSWDGPEVELRDLPLPVARGEALVRDIPPGAVVRVALGVGQGPAFTPLASSPALEERDGALHRWGLEGTRRVEDGDRDAAAIARACARRGAAS